MKSFLLIFNCLFFVTHSMDLKDTGKEVVKSINITGIKFKNRIAGGKPTSLNSFPFNVQFFNLGGMCGGSILTKKTLVTAAHCLDSNKNVEEMTVFSGSRFIHDMKSNAHDVWDFKVHEEYNQSLSFAKDIAVIIIKNEFVFSEDVKIATLCTSEVWMRQNEVLFVSGWGEAKYGEGIAKQQLKMTYLNFVSQSPCEAQIGVKLTPDMFCMYGSGKRDTCRGDSGGGVIWKKMLVGIVSHGEGCVKKPSVYINVSRMRMWIQKAVNKLYQKFCLENTT